MTSKAIDLIKHGKGFFLQVEGASIDRQDHAASPCGQIGGTVDLDEVVTAALNFAKSDGNTLVDVTADQTDLSFTVTNTLALDPADVLPMATPSASLTPSATAVTTAAGWVVATPRPRLTGVTPGLTEYIYGLSVSGIGRCDRPRLVTRGQLRMVQFQCRTLRADARQGDEVVARGRARCCPFK